jgi:hypothetical protein
MDPRVEQLLGGFGQLREQLLGSPLRLDLEQVNKQAAVLIGELGELQAEGGALSEADARKLELAAGRVQALFRSAAAFVLAFPVERNYTAVGELSVAPASRVRVEA